MPTACEPIRQNFRCVLAHVDDAVGDCRRGQNGGRRITETFPDRLTDRMAAAGGMKSVEKTVTGADDDETLSDSWR